MAKNFLIEFDTIKKRRLRQGNLKFANADYLPTNTKRANIFEALELDIKSVDLHPYFFVAINVSDLYLMMGPDPIHQLEHSSMTNINSLNNDQLLTS